MVFVGFLKFIAVLQEQAALITPTLSLTTSMESHRPWGLLHLSRQTSRPPGGYIVILGDPPLAICLKKFLRHGSWALK